MTSQEVTDIIANVPKLDFASMEVSDQIIYMTSMMEFAKNMKPLIVKYSDNLPQDSKFLFKM